MANFYDTVLSVIEQDERFFSQEGTLLRNRVYEAAMNMDAGLLRLLLNNTETKERFFTVVDGITVFDKAGFGWVINNRQFLPDSYTRFKNKIGLADASGELLSASGDVVLSFPYKDCVLEGGQTKDDQKRDEVFFNTTLAPDEVDRLLYPKVLVNAKRYSYCGEYDLTGNPTGGENSVAVDTATEFKKNDNLIIKGNNLLGIASLLKRFEGKVKCIYIDPPYNTGGDGFKYNDNFNHSTWMVFMKNRLEISKRLLSNDGFIFIEIDNNEMHYLKCLCDDIFGRDNFVNDIVWKRRGGSANPQNRLNNVSEYILWYSKSSAAKIKPIYTLDDDVTKEYIQERFVSEIDGRKFMLAPIERNKKLGLRETLRYEYKGYTPEWGWMCSKENLIQMDKEGRLHWNGNNRPNRRVFLDEYQGQPISNLWTDIKVINPMSLERLDFDGQKPEKIIERVLMLSTNVGDLILDFHLGTGTTAAVAQKMKRRYIGIEQMDYIETVTIERLKKVLGGEQSGISQSANWHGGGSFVYCELAKSNQNFVEAAERATTDEELTDLLSQILKTGFISSKVNPADINDNADDFAALSIDDKKRFIIELLDKNMLYVNLSDIDDGEYNIGNEDKAFTRSFYALEEK
jgi:adenine-specific DNA-methyltransferase